MLYDIRQTTTYSYGAPVRAARQVMRMTPVDRGPHQHVIANMLDTRPAPSEAEHGTDFFGNAICYVTFDTPHERLDITMRARIEVRGTVLPDAMTTPIVDLVRSAALTAFDLGPDSPVHGLFPTRSVPLDPAITEWTAESCAADRPILAAALDVMHRIKETFTYEPGATDVATLPAQAFAARAGVCQDFAHVMIAGLRGVGIPARYVSGYLRTIPPPGQPRLAGADATHAWVEVWCGVDLGWVGLDPTNAIPVGEDHIILAIGRDYSDVSPVDGVIVASGEHQLAVGVDVIPVERPQAEAPAS
ncbi:transglutaminase-like putative cysteine protease [Aquabacter spiritensis]|uniref:Transglutaminase-like putative cysteine protease n=2 Tax=Aquabacter spiritensis TaxID=933073 RepID=A0A4R3M4L1_9HYPH|nr:transglutaminase family protein [Aquabacter spiritensis]TCT07972.1 transglutaminase-like putative cysteine protease [Aquabacter spiritensis]